jgi:enterochelin esterase-like enzyme
MSTVVAGKKGEAKRSHSKSKEPLKSVFIEDFYSAALRHNVTLEVILPPWYDEAVQFSFPTVYFNDGQLLGQIHIKETLAELYLFNLIPPVIVIGIHAHNRMQEYGVAGVPDFKKRGNKADKYSRAIIKEILPLIRKNFRTLDGVENNAIAGFSLGGLSAFDIAWNYPHIFGTAGVFSGSFWWRSKGYGHGYDDESDRIMHKMVRGTDSKSFQRFWFECGTHDEMADRNNNGVIDAIEDTLDLIKELGELGFVRGRDIEYVEVPGGQHNEATWAAVMPAFLQWTFGKK